MNKCGNCVFGHVLAQDITKRVCKGAPPTPVVMPVSGGAQMQFHYPVLEASSEACALHKLKLLVDTPSATTVQ